MCVSQALSQMISGEGNDVYAENTSAHVCPCAWLPSHTRRVGTVAAHCSARPCLAVMSMAHCVLLMRTVSPMRAVGSAARKVMLCAERVGKGVRLEGWLRLPGYHHRTNVSVSAMLNGFTKEQKSGSVQYRLYRTACMPTPLFVL